MTADYVVYVRQGYLWEVHGRFPTRRQAYSAVLDINRSGVEPGRIAVTEDSQEDQ